MIVFGTIRNDILPGSENDDFIFGFKGNDTIFCSLGSDTVWGGAGDDDFLIAPQFGGEVVTINGGRGHDTLVLSREPIQVEEIGNKVVIHYDYDMLIIATHVEEIMFT